MMDQNPRTFAASPAAFFILVLANAVIEILGEADIEAALRVAQNVDEKH